MVRRNVAAVNFLPQPMTMTVWN